MREQSVTPYVRALDRLAKADGIQAYDQREGRIDVFLICERCYYGSKNPEVIDPRTLRCTNTRACRARANEHWMKEAEMGNLSKAQLSAPRDLRPLIDAALRAGWTLEHQTDHDVLVTPAGVKATSIPRHRSGFDYRQFKNTRADLIRNGLHLTGRPPKGFKVEHPVSPHPERAKPEPVIERQNGHAKPVTVTSVIDGPLVPGTTRPAVVQPTRQNEKPFVETPKLQTFPLLDALAERQRAAIRVNEASELMSKAAALLRDKDRDDLLAEAVRLLDTVSLSPIELEYLAYAEAHRRRD